MASPNPNKTYVFALTTYPRIASILTMSSQLLEKSLIETDPEVAEIMVRPASLF